MKSSICQRISLCGFELGDGTKEAERERMLRVEVVDGNEGSKKTAFVSADAGGVVSISLKVRRAV